MSRRREQGEEVTSQTRSTCSAPGVGGIPVGHALVVTFLLWQAAAWEIYRLTLGPAEPTSIGAFDHDVFLTAKGHALIVIGVGVGFLFAVFAMAISLVSFPLLIDRDVGLDTAIKTSIEAVRVNPVPDGVVGTDRGGGPRHRIDPALHGIGDHGSRAWPRDVASLQKARGVN